MTSTTISKNLEFIAIIVAAGRGTRFSGEKPKQYYLLNGRPILSYSLEAFSRVDCISRIDVVVQSDDAFLPEFKKRWLEQFSRVRFLPLGGATRSDSVKNALNAQTHVSDETWILVHDAARPGITDELIYRLIKTLQDDPVGGLLALPIADTVKKKDNNCLITINRDHLYLAQTPQMFRYGLLKQALMRYPKMTDESSAVEQLGRVPKLVLGHVQNNKITTPLDLTIAQALIKE